MSHLRGRATQLASTLSVGNAQLGDVVQEVVEQDLSGQQRQEWQQRRRDRHAQHVAEVGARAHQHVLGDVAETASTFDHAAVHRRQALFEQDDVGGCLGDVHAVRHGDADVRGVQRRRVVDPVADIAHHVPVALQGADQAVLLGRIDAREHVGLLDDRDQRAVGEAVQLVPEDQTIRFQAHLSAHAARDELAVAGQDLDGHAALTQLGDDFGGRRIGRVLEGDEAAQHQVAFVGGGQRVLVGCDCLPGNAQHVVARATQALVGVRRALASGVRERCLPVRAIDGRAGGDDALGRAFHQHLHAFGAAGQHADPAPFEVERQLGALLVRWRWPDGRAPGWPRPADCARRSPGRC